MNSDSKKYYNVINSDIIKFVNPTYLKSIHCKIIDDCIEKIVKLTKLECV